MYTGSYGTIQGSVYIYMHDAIHVRYDAMHQQLSKHLNMVRGPIKLGPRILKFVVFEAHRRLLHPHLGTFDDVLIQLSTL
jgi:hypothetical protein